MAQDERTMNGRAPQSPAASPPGYGGLSEGTVGDPSAAGQKGAPAKPAAAPEGAPDAREQATGDQDVEEGDASAGPVDTPRGGGSSNEAIPGVFDGSNPLNPESSAEHKSSWPDEGATGEAGAG
ncbi:hypothetical protein BE21_33710 [Sorangium cellulosum]|uniref:Uncharacterized protein n=1 Tax=Sorangium cellulosum TaxID=56 RepID=A0A150TPP7_SORCE|nr:hypothetical protein BE21_33710 [Sorangium cellulosum]